LSRQSAATANSRFEFQKTQSAFHPFADRNVPFQQTTDLVEKLRARNVAVEERIFTDEIHNLLRWNDCIRA